MTPIATHPPKTAGPDSSVRPPQAHTSGSVGTRENDSQLVRRSGFALMGRVVMAACRGLGLILVSRALGVAAFGEYSLVVASYAIASGIGTLGLDQAYVHVAGRGRPDTAALLRNAVWASQILGLAAGLLLLATAHALRARIFYDTPWAALQLTSTLLPGVLLQNTLSGMVVGRAWFRYHGLTESAKWILHLALVGAFAARSALGIETALLALYLPIVLFGCVHAVALLRSESLSPWRVLVGRPHRAGLREVASFGTRACAINVAHVLHMRLDLYLIKYFFASSRVVGQYALAVSLTDVLLYLGRSVGLVQFAQRSAVPGAPARSGPRAARLAAGIVFGGAVLAVTSGASLVGLLFGPEFGACTGVVLCRLPGLLAETAAFVLGGDLLGLARMRPILAANLAAVAVGGLLNCALVPAAGIVAAAAAFSAASCLRLVMVARAHARASGQRAAGYLRPAWKDLEALRLRPTRGPGPEVGQ